MGTRWRSCSLGRIGQGTTDGKAKMVGRNKKEVVVFFWVE